MAIVGYARVSTRDQDLAGQLAELKAAGCELVYREKVSGAASDRKELARLVRKLERGDTVIVTRLDRLARSTRDLLNILDEIGKAGAGFRSIKDLGGYHHVAFDHPRRTRGVRARTHQGSNGRRPGACEGSRREVRSQTEAQPVPA